MGNISLLPTSLVKQLSCFCSPIQSNQQFTMILNASIITRGGKIVVSRSFREIQRSRVEALLASFPKLASSGSGSQHTVVEANSVRYVWQNLDEFYLVLITNVGSNILQDID